MLKVACCKGSSGSLWKFVIFTLADCASAIYIAESPVLRGFCVSWGRPGYTLVYTLDHPELWLAAESWRSFDGALDDCGLALATITAAG